MSLILRPGNIEDAEACGAICYHAFRAIAEHHRFPPDFPSVQVAVGFLSQLLSHPGFYSVVAEDNGRIVGSNFLDERSHVAGVGPITIDPEVQNRGIGKSLMEDVLRRVEQRAFPGVRLLQSTYHNRSLCLYTKLGFQTREPISTIQGPAIQVELPGFPVRSATEADLEACDRLCLKVHGHTRSGELTDAIALGKVCVVERDGKVTGYSTSLAFFGHSVGETNDDLKALIGAASEFQGPGFLLPTRNVELFQWCLSKGLRVVQPLTLMSIGMYNEPAGAYLPSIWF